ncbi:uncharacterized protein LOC124279656 [Haliotis rubra]|uniref:uncharacterized protein LOC124279656 n=1 Tax=Haliotis rubra TaxID=36100 RepID=UPI001EE53E48|nr:uncharacterized protein LOC124279656 [Haliotis rubra]
MTMRRNFVIGLFLMKPKYGLAISLCLCIVTVIISLYFLDDLTLKVPLVQLEVFPKPEKEALSQNINVPVHAPVILNDIEIEVANSSSEQIPQHACVELKNISRHLQLNALIPSNRDRILLNHFQNTSVHRTNSNREKYIIYYCRKNITCCGWGDRQHGILSAYVISLVTNRTFGVDMSSPCLLSNLFHPRKLNWKINSTLLQGLSTKYLYTVNDKVFRQLIGQIDFDAVYPQDVVYLTTNYDYFYALKNNPYYKTIFRQKLKTKPRPIVFADLWQNIFKLNRRVKRRLTTALAKAKPTQNFKLVCAHLRFGKNPTLPWDSEVRNTMESVSVVWDFFKKYNDHHRYRIFVASDSDNVRSKAMELFPLQNVEIEGDIIHIDKTKRIKVDPCVGFEKVLADQYFLSMCDVLVLTYSVFGKAAAYMRRSNNDLYFLEDGQIKPLKVFNDRFLLENGQSKS